ncbi:calcium-binding protein [Rhizobium alvei]|uniref:Uncharacterized protein n=1 Tax=Rhizobium alvei TaxID=1132659 RepID=A0ABT8YHS8_9HYPH|nr:M10 family metallopeptidase C-terminal domain-containing protein [Rhizobium alvei]MDO6963240.1 hypothetical protein [Rhizobium alvei]
MQLSFEGGMFGKDLGTAIDYTFLDLSFDDSDSDTIELSQNILDVANVWAKFNYSYDFSFALLGTAHLDLGKIESSFDLESNATTSDSDLAPNSSAFIDLSGFSLGESEDGALSATGPSAAESYVKIDLSTSIEGSLSAEVGYDYDIGVDWGDGSTTLFDTDFSASLDETIFEVTADILGGLDGEIYELDLGFGTVAAAIPEFEYDEVELVDDGSQFGSYHLTGKSSPVVTAEVDLDAFLPVPLSVDESLDLSVVSFTVETGLLDAKLVGTASIGQDITVTPDVEVTMETSLGETVTGDLGDKFEFETPEGEGSFTVTATYQLMMTVTAVTSLVFDASIDWQVAYGKFEAGIDVGVYQDKWETGFSAFESSEPLTDGIALELASDTSVYEAGSATEEFTLYYENFVTAASGVVLNLTTHQVSIKAGTEDNQIKGNDLANSINGYDGNDTINAGKGDDTVYGGIGEDTIFGGNDNDMLLGRMGSDTISGGSGNDTIFGGRGKDILTGGKDADTFLFDDGGSFSQRDTITDFRAKQGDLIDLSQIDADANLTDDQAFTFIDTDAFSGQAGELRIQFTKGEGLTVFADMDGDGRADGSIFLEGIRSITADQFVL